MTVSPHAEPVSASLRSWLTKRTRRGAGDTTVVEGVDAGVTFVGAGVLTAGLVVAVRAWRHRRA
jgi:hypothetical protein